MAEFTYLAKDNKGSIQKGTIDSSSREMVVQTLIKRGLTPQSIKLVKKTGMNMNIKLPGGNKVKSKSLVVFTRQFSTMISAGVPMLRALNTLQEQTDSKVLKEALRKIVSDVEGGTSLSEAFEKHPKVFSSVYVNMVRAGETGGILDQIMSRLANQVEKDAEIKGKFKSAMIYPIVVSLVAVGAVGFLMVGVVPKLAGILETAGGELPIQTKIILGISNVLTNQWYIILAVVVISVFAFRRFTSTPSGKYTFHKFLLRVPIFLMML